MRTLAVLAMLLPLLAVLAVVAGRPVAREAAACSGGIGPIEWFAPEADHIFIGTAIDVGDEVNRAPTLAPTETPTATPTVEPDTSTRSPEPTTSPFPNAEPMTIVLTGVETTLRVDRVLVGEVPNPYVTGTESRRYIEEALRRNEAGILEISSCTPDAFVPRYEIDAQYLVFSRIDATGGTAYEFVQGVFRVDGDQVVLDDPKLNMANQGLLYMQGDLYRRYFADVAADITNDFVYVTAPNVPLSSMLAAVGSLRGETPTILPPETGLAGLR